MDTNVKSPQEAMMGLIEGEETTEEEFKTRLTEARESIEEGSGNPKAIVYNADGKKIGTLADQADWEAFDDADLGATKKIKGKDMIVVSGKTFSHNPKFKKEKTVYVSI